MTYARAWFELQLEFAQKVADVTGLPLFQTLLEYTNLYVRFGLGREFDPAQPRWRQYLAGLESTRDHGAWTHEFYRQQPEATVPGLMATSGCFSFATLGDGRVRLHFRNIDPDDCSPLALERLELRQSELSSLLTTINAGYQKLPRVVGASWLYNLSGYRRLFPPAYLTTARVLTKRFQSMPLWGQFLDRHLQVRPAARAEFLQRLALVSHADQLDQCFPLPVLTLEASALEFHDFYRISQTR